MTAKRARLSLKKTISKNKFKNFIEKSIKTAFPTHSNSEGGEKKGLIKIFNTKPITNFNYEFRLIMKNTKKTTSTTNKSTTNKTKSCTSKAQKGNCKSER